MKVSCIAGVLAGGASKRFGAPKALLKLANGRTMLEHVATDVSTVAEHVVILGRPPSVPRTLAAIRILPDARADCGPMGGLCALLEHAAPHWGLLVACDLPALDATVLQRLLQAAATSPDAEAVTFVCPSNRDTYEACCALYHPRLHPVALEALRAGNTGLQALLRRVRTVALMPAERQARALFDVDTLQDLDVLGDLMA